MAEFETRVNEETAAKEQDALEGMTKQHRERRALMLQHSPASWLHKRGGAMKTWKKRYCAIENGVLYYYVSPADREGGKPALGALVLHGSTVRRPSDLSGKGKYKNTCFRIDLDPHVQASNVKSVKGSIKGGSSTEGGFSDEEDESAAEAKGRTDKPKWILAAESERMMWEWMEDVRWWAGEGMKVLTIDHDARKAGRVLTDEEKEKIKEAAITEVLAEDNAPLPTPAEVDALSLAALRRLIARANLDSHDCTEKAELRARALEAITKLSGADEPTNDAAGDGPEEEEEEEEPPEEEGEEADVSADVMANRTSTFIKEASVRDDDPLPSDVPPPDVSEPSEAVVMPPPLPPPTSQPELDSWTPYALAHQLKQMGQTADVSVGQEALAERYWAALKAKGSEEDDVVRRFLLLPKSGGFSAGGDVATEATAKLWIAAVIGEELGEGDLLPMLRSGEILCDTLNGIRSGLVPKVARSTDMVGLHISKINARMRENIGQYVDGCAELGMAQRDLFMTSDLFDNKDPRAVLRHFDALLRFVQEGVPGFVGPFAGKKARKKQGYVDKGGAVPAPSWNPILSAPSAQPTKQVVLGNRGIGGYQPQIGGRGM